MVDSELLAALDLLTPGEQKALLAVAEYLKTRRDRDENEQTAMESIVAELAEGPPEFGSSDEGLSSARRAARRFMRENPTLMRLLAQ
jgi:hypothetical protein